MGGSGSGGARVGAGKKPKARPRVAPPSTPAGVLRVVGGDPGVVRGSSSPPPAAGADPLLTPPATMSRAEKAIWIREAPRAIKRGTLLDETHRGFTELCENIALKDEIKRRMKRNKGGAAAKASESLLRQFVRIGQRVDVLLARFKLTSFGKADESAPNQPEPVKAINPWSAVG